MMGFEEGGGIRNIERWMWNGDGYRSFFFQAEYGIRDIVRSRGLGDVYK